MLQLFRNQRPATFFILLIIGVVSRFSIFIFTYIDALSLPTLKTGAGVSVALSTVVVLLQAFWLNHIFTKAQIISEKTVLPALIWILLTCIPHSYLYLDWHHLYASLLILFLNIIYPVTQGAITLRDSFHLGLISGFLAVMYPPFSVFLPFGLIIVYIKNPPSVRAYLLYIMGIASTIIWSLSFVYIADYSFYWLEAFQQLFPWLQVSVSLYEILTWIVLGLFFIGGIVGLLSTVSVASAKKKKDVWTLLILISGLVLVTLISFNQLESSLVYIFLPMSYAVSVSLLIIRKKKFAETLFAIFAITIIAIKLLESSSVAFGVKV